MVLVCQAFDGYPWAVCFQNCSSVWFRKLMSNEGGQRGGRRMDVILKWAASLGPEDSKSMEDGSGKRSLPVWFRSLMEVEERLRENGRACY